MKKREQKKGSVILPTLLIIMIIVGIGSTYLSMSFHEFKLAYRNEDLQSAINLAEAGIEEAILAMKTKDWSNWSSVATGHYYKTITNLGLGNGRTGVINIYSSILDTSAPIVFTEGKISSEYGTVRKQIRLDLSRKGLFANGLTAKNSITFSGNNVSVDSYSSDDGPYHSSTNRNDNGSVASTAVDVGAIAPGNGDIWGYVATGGGAPDFGPNGTVLGEDSPSGIKIDPDRVADDFYAEFPNVSTPTPFSPIATLPVSGTIGIPSATSPTYYQISNFSNHNSDTLVIDGPIVIITDGTWSTKGEIQITNNGSLEVYTSGDFDIGGNGVVNMTNIPANVLIYGTNTVTGAQSIKISGNGAIQAAIYAPNAVLEIVGGGSSGVFMGAAVAHDIDMTGNTEFHYDESLGNFGTDGSYKIERWRELIDTDEKVPLDYPNQMIAHAVAY